MSWYTDTVVCIDPEHAMGFFSMLKAIKATPDKVAYDSDYGASALWQNRNHFHASVEWKAVQSYLDSIPDESWGCEVVDEDWDRDVTGCYGVTHCARIEYDLEGGSVDLDLIGTEEAD